MKLTAKQRERFDRGGCLLKDCPVDWPRKDGAPQSAFVTTPEPFRMAA